MSLIERIALNIKKKKEKEQNRGQGPGPGPGLGVDPGPDSGLNLEPEEHLDFLFIDADSKDPSLGLSAPPKTFITLTALKTFHQGTVRTCSTTDF